MSRLGGVQVEVVRFEGQYVVGLGCNDVFDDGFLAPHGIYRD